MRNHLIPNKFGFINWKWVIPYALVIYATLPFARNLIRFFNEISNEGLGFLINVIFITAGTGFTAFLIHQRKYGIKKSLSLIGIVLAFLFLMFLIDIPEERIHFLEYGGLGFLTPKARSFSLDNHADKIWAVILISLIGILDEVIQWILPERFFDLRDIVFNVVGGVGGFFVRLKFCWASGKSCAL